MGKHTFKYESDYKQNQFDITDVEVSLSRGEETLTEVLEAFEKYLHAVGFTIKGNLVVEEQDD